MTAVATRQDAPQFPIARLVGSRITEIGASAYKGFNAQMVLEMAHHASLVNPAILNCTPESVFRSICDVARWGLHIGDTVDLIPFNDKGKSICTAVCRYTGLMALAYRQRLARLITPFPVFEGDDFDFSLGVPSYLKHRPVADPAKRGKLIGAYITILLPGGLTTFHWMSIADVEVVRAKSRQWNPSKVPVCPAWYAMKSCIRNWLNKQPKSGAGSDYQNLSSAMEAEDADFEVITPAAGELAPPSAPAQVSTHEPAAEPARPARAIETPLASGGQKTLLRQIMLSHVWTEDEKAQAEEYLDNPNLTRVELMEKIDAVQEIVTDRKHAEREEKKRLAALEPV